MWLASPMISLLLKLLIYHSFLLDLQRLAEAAAFLEHSFRNGSRFEALVCAKIGDGTGGLIINKLLA